MNTRLKGSHLIIVVCSFEKALSHHVFDNPLLNICSKITKYKVQFSRILIHFTFVSKTNDLKCKNSLIYN